MSGHDCDATLRALELDGRVEGVAARHLEGCADCRREVEASRPWLRSLAASASIEPPPALDRAVRALLTTPQRVGRPFRRPLVAAGLAAASVIALVAALALELAESGAAEQAPAIAVLAVSAWLALSAATTAPLLMSSRLRQALERHS